MLIDPRAPALRERVGVRASVDDKLGPDSRLSLAEAAALLSPVERVEWLLGELWVLAHDRRFHLWVQGFALGSEPDFLRALAGVAEVARPIQPRVAELVRWTAARGLAARTGERGDTLISVVPEVWAGHWNQAVDFLESTVARWPEDLDPLALPEPPRWRRDIVTASPEAPRYPGAQVSLAEPGQVLEAACCALWRAGASDDDLDAFYFEAGGPRWPEALLEWVSVEGDPDLAAVRAVLTPPHPLELWLEVENVAWPSLVRFSRAQLDAAAAVLASTPTVRIEPTRDCPFATCVRSALRRDPDILLVDADDLAPDDAALLHTSLLVGLVVAVGGESAGASALEALVEGSQLPLLRRAPLA